MSQRPTFDINSLSTGDKLILGGAGVFFIWSLLPVWYKAGPFSYNAWGGVTVIAALMALLAIAWVVVRLIGIRINLNVKPGLIDLGLAGAGVLFTLLGLVVKRYGIVGFSWGLIVGLLISLGWAYGAYMKYSEPAETVPPAMPGPPPAPPPAPGPPPAPPESPPGPPSAPGPDTGEYPR
jgi:hypothetical protein